MDAAVDLERFRVLLQRFEALVARRGIPIVDHWAPGLSGEAIDAAAERVGLRLPVEARAWFQWHDGVTGIEARNYSEVRAQIGIRDYEFLTLEEAFAARSMLRDSAIRCQTATSPADELYPASWLPLLRADNGDYLIIDCDAPEGAPTPVRRYGAGDEDNHQVRAMSLTRTVEVWVAIYEQALAAADAAPPGVPEPRVLLADWMYREGGL